MEFKYAPNLLKKYAKNILRMSPKTYEVFEARVENFYTGEIEPGKKYVLKNSRREEVVTSEELSAYNEYA